jgi:hypothetical protein
MPTVRYRSCRCTRSIEKIYARSVTGRFVNWRWALVWLTQIIFYGLPWLMWNDRQAVLFDLVNAALLHLRLVLYPQDFIYLTALLMVSGLRAVPVHRGGRAAVVRLRLPADGVHRDLHVDRAQDRRRPRPRMKLDKAPGRPGNRLGASGGKQAAWIAIALWTGFTFVGYFTPIRTLAAAGRPGLWALGDLLGAVLRLRHLRQRRLHARAGVQVHVPVRALPERHVRQGHADHHLRHRARRAARLALKKADPKASWAWASASTATCACRSAPPASTSARACSTNASAAPPAWTCATT